MSVSVTADWKYRDMTTVILENELIRAVIIPELGAKLWQLTYKPASKDLLWHHPRIPPRPVPPHSVYDDVFFGGWDELFPNDIPETLGGENEPDHGELWTLPWDFKLERTENDEAAVRLWTDTPISASRIEKRISLRCGENIVRFRHRLTNTGTTDQPYLWKLHAAMKADEHSRIDLPAKSMYIEHFGAPRSGETGVHYNWPYADGKDGTRHDMRMCLPSDSGVTEFQYATELSGGWCAITDTRSGIGMGIVFDTAVFPSCWLFATYGGWRSLHTVVLEPCTGYPISVNEGVNQGTHRTLKAGKTIECDVMAVIYDGYASVSSIDSTGRVTGEPKSAV